MNPLVAALILQSGTQIQPPGVGSGERSNVSSAEVRLIGTEWDWMRAWIRHTGQSEGLARWERAVRQTPEVARYGFYNEERVPEVDFARNVVLARLGGKVQQVAGYTILACELDGDTLTVRYVPRYFSVASPTVRDGSEWVRTPFLLAVLPRTFNRLRLEEAVVKDKFKPIDEFRLVTELSVPPESPSTPSHASAGKAAP